MVAVLVKKSVVCHKTHHGSLGEREEGREILSDVSLVSNGLAPMLEEGSPRAQRTGILFSSFGKQVRERLPSSGLWGA